MNDFFENIKAMFDGTFLSRCCENPFFYDSEEKDEKDEKEEVNFFAKVTDILTLLLKLVILVVIMPAVLISCLYRFGVSLNFPFQLIRFCRWIAEEVSTIVERNTVKKHFQKCVISECNLIVIGHLYIKKVEQLEEQLDDLDDLNLLLEPLSFLKLNENYVLDDYRPKEQTNSILWLYVRPKFLNRPDDKCFENQKFNLYHVFGGNNNKYKVRRTLKIGNVFVFRYTEVILPKNPFNHIILPFTEGAIWQIYLLIQTRHLVGMRWHGCYETRTFIFSYEDIAKIQLYREDDKTRLVAKIQKNWRDDLAPIVNLQKNKAIITHCWFNEWAGLIQVKAIMEYDNIRHNVRNLQIDEGHVLMQYKVFLYF